MSNTKFKSITIDGPSGAGKSTIAKKISEKIGFLYVDTGALYRAVGLYILRNNISSKDKDKIENNLNNIDIIIKYINSEQRVFLNGEDISDEIRTTEIAMVASDVSVFKPVRDFLLELQRDIARNNNVVMDGRDIATVVIPDASLKIFLTASEKCRALRRYNQILKSGIEDITFDDVYKDLIIRDKNDSNRKISPLKKADGAILIDSSDMNVSQTLEFIYNIVREKLYI